MVATSVVPFLSLAGSPYEIGLRHGRERAPALRAFLDDGLCRLNRVLPSPVTRDALAPVLAAYGEAIEAATPDLAEEIRGLADGAGIAWSEAVMLQVRREILGYRKVPTMGDCTTYARSGDVPVLAQTVDLNGDLDDQIAVLRVAVSGSPRRTLVLSFGGLLGYLGLNSSGLAIGLNLVLGGEWRPGLPPYLAIRHLLEVCDSVEQAVAELRALRLASSRSIMLCDRRQAGYVEILGDETRLRTADRPVHTNHYLEPEFAPHDEVNVFARNSSRRRLAAAGEALERLPADAGAERHFEILSAPPICVGDTGDIRRERTVAAVVAFPDRGELHVRPGDPSRSRTSVFTVG
ncbi:C45 family peptidase [Microtetraspora glauca]|uniref:C45 family peptidase n=1 Tax=Microtetraspora glauca TaxID=1996 RepID=A0ABV3GKZ7_MICGL